MYTIKFAKDSKTLQIFILQKCQTKTTASPAGGIRGSDAVVCFLKATPHKARLTALHAICVQIFRHIAQKSLAIRQYACGISGQSAEKSDNAPYAQALCGVALMLFRGFQLPQIAAQKGVKAAHCLLPSGVAVQL